MRVFKHFLEDKQKEMKNFLNFVSSQVLYYNIKTDSTVVILFPCRILFPYISR